jgi:hypothetical protein
MKQRFTVSTYENRKGERRLSVLMSLEDAGKVAGDNRGAILEIRAAISEGIRTAGGPVKTTKRS